MKKTLKDFDFKNKRVLLRADLNVPLDNKEITNDARIRKSLPSIKYILDQGGSVVLLSHLGRPKGVYDENLSLKPVAKRISELLGQEVKLLADKNVISDEIIEEIKKVKAGQVVMLENTRFNPAEKKNDQEFSKKLAGACDIFISDAFGTTHRAHASNVGVASFLPSGVGFLIEKEIKYFSEALNNPKRPFVIIMGGVKVSDKIGVIENLFDKVDKLIIVGAMAYTFYKAMGYSVGKSFVEEDKLDLAKSILDQAKEKKVKLILPVDTLVAPEMKNGYPRKVVSCKEIPDDLMGLDIGDETIKEIKEELKDARTVIWNGPAGVFELEDFSKGTFAIAEILANLDQALTVIGGGDSASAVEKSGYEDKISHISTGGGASLELIEGKKLPGIECIEEA
ncbi:phosphoglycerate kinase [Peptoniphilus obesi]|uniref:phosphoglycerate kinase n=1 Tax=Peptoniphilus obesi TaxID=1472765 RepID=UPI0004B97536|nr:phosphoglycerate kinase [Peptoniphilus obesi]